MGTHVRAVPAARRPTHRRRRRPWAGHRPRLHRRHGRHPDPVEYPGWRPHHDRHPAGGAVTRVLIIDDDPQLLRALAVNLRARRYDVDTAPDGTSALAAVSRRPPDVVILDLGLPDMDGVDVVHGLR